jgi:ketosteroid isomerase-like protein
MSHVDELRARYEGISKEDLGVVFRDVHPEFELKTADRVPGAGTYRGAEAATRFFTDLVDPFEEVSYIPEEFFEHRNQVVVYLHIRFRPGGSSSMVENHIGSLWTFRDGQPVRCEIFPQREKALEAAGMSEQDAVDA